MAGKVILETDIKRKLGMLYYCGTSKNGNITVNETEMARGKRKVKGGKKK